MIYCDTSLLLSLYVADDWSGKAEEVWSFDERQRRLAEGEELEINF